MGIVLLRASLLIIIMKHPNKARNKYKHGIASYPLGFKGYVVSEKKICLQFNNVQCKTRVNKEHIEQLEKKPWMDKAMPIDTLGTDIEFLAVGIPLHLYPTVLDNLLIANKEHIELYKDDNLKDYLVDYAHKILDTFSK